MIDIQATYSAEDNKLRLYPAARLDAETFSRVKEAGFKWAPKQELFVAPKWTTQREDLCIELAGEIEPEGTTMAERALAKAERLDAIAEKRAHQANAFARRADELSRAFDQGQPILVGHHSERKARKIADQVDSNMTKAAKAHSAIQYWQWRAEGVERHANYKNRSDVRARRIKTLLSDLRDHQRALNHHAECLRIWDKCNTDNLIRMVAARGVLKSGQIVPYADFQAVENGEMTPQELRTKYRDQAVSGLNNERRRRWINHILGRLTYERAMLGETARYTGELTPAILQAFAREHGADKPKAQHLECGSIRLTSPLPLPMHLADGETLEMSGDEWRDLMQSTGYEVPAPKPKKPPILNFKADAIQTKNRYRGGVENREQIELTKAEYSAIHKEARWTELSACGRFRFKVCLNPKHKGDYFSRPRVAVFLTDSKTHPAPEPIVEAA